MSEVQKTHFADDATLERLHRYKKALEEIAETTIENRVEYCIDGEKAMRIAREALKESGSE